MVTTAGNRADKAMAMPAFKHLIGCLAIAGLAPLLRTASLTICSIFFTIVELVVVVSVLLLQTQKLFV
jgi:hypothetical protein